MPLFHERSAPRQMRQATCWVAAFGKHPAWDDHIDDIGVETPELTELKRRLYLQGIAGNLNAGAWEALRPEARLPGFEHAFYVHLDDGFIVGRLWPSSDGKGRRAYPLVICAHWRGPAGQREQAVNRIMPALEAAHEACVGSQDAASVIAAIEAARDQLSAEMDSDVGEAPPPPLWALYDALGGDARAEEAIARALYHVDRSAGAAGEMSSSAPTVHLRVPSAGLAAVHAARLWIEALAAWRPMHQGMGIAPTDRDWVDVLTPAPTTQTFFCLRAGLAASGLTTEVPYRLPSDHLARVRAGLQDEPARSQMPGPHPRQRDRFGEVGLLVGLALVGMLVVGVVIAMILLAMR